MANGIAPEESSRTAAATEDNKKSSCFNREHNSIQFVATKDENKKQPQRQKQTDSRSCYDGRQETEKLLQQKIGTKNSYRRKSKRPCTKSL